MIDSQWHHGIDSESYRLQEALKFHQQISDLCADGKDIRVVLSAHFANLDTTRYIPCDPMTGAWLSLGSVLHFVNTCKPCSFFSTTTCHKNHLCLFCHFAHGRQ